MFLKLPIIGSDKPSKPELANHSLGKTEASSEISGSDKSNKSSIKVPKEQKSSSREELEKLSTHPDPEAGDNVSGKALKFTEIPKPLQDFLIKNLGVNNAELQNQMIITEPSKINDNGAITSQFIIKLAPESAAKLLKKGALHFLSKINPFRNKSFDKAELNKLAEGIHTNTIPKVNHEISTGKIMVQLLVNFNENTKNAEVGGLALSHRPQDFIHEHPRTLKIIEHLKKELPKLEKKLLNDTKDLEPKAKELIERSLADVNGFVNLNPKAQDKEIATHAKSLIVLEHVARTGKERKLTGKGGRDDGREIDVTNFAENLREGERDSIISMLGKNVETDSLKWRGVNINNLKEVIDRNRSFISRFSSIDPRYALLSSISEMLFYGKHLSEKQIREALIANVESTIKYNLENEAKAMHH